jgi:NAD(P)-dependent dehydrogenase (short-subunit alcohol dehydrogenase family)
VLFTSSIANHIFTALIGGASGIGLAITRHFVSEGQHVAVLDRNVETGADVLGQLKSEFPATKVIFKQCDVSSWESQHHAFEEVYKEYGSIDVVFANAGITEHGQVIDFDEETPSAPNLATLNVNLIGVLFCK